jgi:hypothetical protein
MSKMGTPEDNRLEFTVYQFRAPGAQLEHSFRNEPPPNYTLAVTAVIKAPNGSYRDEDGEALWVSSTRPPYTHRRVDARWAAEYAQRAQDAQEDKEGPEDKEGFEIVSVDPPGARLFPRTR